MNTRINDDLVYIKQQQHTKNGNVFVCVCVFFFKFHVEMTTLSK